MSNYKMALRKQNMIKTLSLIFAFLCVIYLAHTPRKGCSQGRQEEMASKFMTKDVEEDVEVCSAIIRSDLDGINKNHLGKVLRSMKKTSLLSESYYINATADCQAYIKNRGFLTVHLSKAEKDFPIAYSMVIHEKIEMFERLLRAIYTPQNVYCVHVDKKSPKIFIEAVKAIVACLPNVFVASKLESIVYASWSRVQADINCMKDLLKFPVQWRYLLNTCGTDFPIKTNAEIVQSLKHLNGRNSLESEATNYYKRLRWEYHHNVTNMVIRTDVKKTPPPIKTPMFMGNAYFVVTRGFVEHLFKSQDIKNFMEWEQDTYSPDEHLWATLHRMPTVPGSNPPNQKYDESDMMSISRLVKWSYLEGDIQKGAPYESCRGTHRHAVCIYGTGDLKWILMQKHLFANKFDPLVDDVVIKCLEAFLRHKAIQENEIKR